MIRPAYLKPYKLSTLQRAFLIPYFGVRALLDPSRGDLVAGLGDVSSDPVLQGLMRELRRSPSGRQLLKEKPLITRENMQLERLRALPEESLGRQYAAFMDKHDFSADERSPVRFMTDEEAAYVLVRYRQVHDFWHVLAGLPPTLLGEVALKCFEFRVTGLPMAGLAGTLGQLKLQRKDLPVLYGKYLPWAMQTRATAADLLSYRYEQQLHKPVEQVRFELNFSKAPEV